MTRIRKLFCFDYPKIKKMISYLGAEENDKFIKALVEEPAGILNNILPLAYKFKQESYILLENDEILGIIAVAPTVGNPYKINITRLVFKQDYYIVGKQLIEFIIAKYGAKGAHSFTVFVDESHDELCDLFVKGCGFRQCSYENLWKLDNFIPQSLKTAPFRVCQNSDAKSVARLYNNELNNLFKPSMERIPSEYIDPFFEGLSSCYKNRYVLYDNDNLIAYLSLTTVDNLNFIIDVSLNTGYEFDYDEIINFALSEIKRRKSKFTAFVKHRQYAKNADRFEEYLHSRNLNCVQTQCVFVKDFYRPIKQSENVFQVFLFGENNVLTN